MRPFSVLLIRILALYLVLNPLLSVSPLLFTPQLEVEWQAVLAGVGIPLLAGVALWISANSLASKIHGTSSADDARVPISESGLVRAGSFLIGVYLFIQHIGAVINQWAWGGGIAYGSLTVAVLALVLMLGARFWGALYLRLKYFE